MIIRHPDWRSRLYLFLEAHRRAPFQWGQNDCCLFVCDAILEMTGIDIAFDFRGKYQTKREALFLMRDLGYTNLRGVIQSKCETYKLEPILASFTRFGDIMLLPGGEDGPMLGLVINTHVAIPNQNGMAIIKKQLDVQSWRI